MGCQTCRPLSGKRLGGLEGVGLFGFDTCSGRLRPGYGIVEVIFVLSWGS
jgi:hypothetical protein